MDDQVLLEKIDNLKEGQDKIVERLDKQNGRITKLERFIWALGGTTAAGVASFLTDMWRNSGG